MEKIVFLLVIALCGTHAFVVEEGPNRIVGGTLAAENQFRYAISLQRLSQVGTYTRGHRCGGALITLQHVLTSATCLFDFAVDSTSMTTVQINPNEYRVFAGALTLTNDASADRVRGIARFTIHPDYLPRNPNANDIAIITLASPFPNNAVSTVPLSETDATITDLNACTVAGWGSHNSTSTASVALTYLTKTIFDSNACQAVYQWLSITSSMTCAIHAAQPSASCVGDQGNPLVCNNHLNGIFTSGTYCVPLQSPEVYTRVSAYRNWINNVTGGASTFQPAMFVLAIITVVQVLTTKVLC